MTPNQVSDDSKKKGRPAVRVLIRMLKILLVPLMCVIALFAGLVAGYVYLGHQPLDDVWDIRTWRHLFDLVFSPS